MKQFAATVMPSYERSHDYATMLKYRYFGERLDTLQDSYIMQMGLQLEMMNNTSLPASMKRELTDELIMELNLSMSLDGWFLKKVLA